MRQSFQMRRVSTDMAWGKPNNIDNYRLVHVRLG